VIFGIISIEVKLMADTDNSKTEDIQGTKKDAKGKKKDKPKSINDILKYEIAEELGLMDKVNSTGWKSLTAKESGKIGGIVTKRKREMQNPEIQNTEIQKKEN